MAVESEYRGKALCNVVATPIDGGVVGVEIRSKPIILPKIKGEELPDIPRCRDRHIVRTEQHVVVVDVVARVKVFPRIVNFNDVWAEACESVDAALEDEGIVDLPIEKYTEGVRAIAVRIAHRLQLQGMTIR